MSEVVRIMSHLFQVFVNQFCFFVFLSIRGCVKKKIFIVPTRIMSHLFQVFVNLFFFFLSSGVCVKKNHFIGPTFATVITHYEIQLFYHRCRTC